MTYTELKARADSYMHRTDLTTLWPTFIANAEAVMFREIDLRELEMSASFTSVNNFITLPSDFATMGRLTINTNGLEVDVPYNNRTESYTSTTNLTFSQENNKLRVFPSSNGQIFTLYYTAVIVPLSDSVATNWLSLNAADLYMYASCLEAAKWARDGDQVITLTQMVANLIESVRSLSKRRAKPNRGSLRLRLRPTLI